jgi:hypothetical protein
LTFERVRGVLLRHLKNTLAFDDWFRKAQTTYTGKRLAICLAIDLELRLISASDVDSIIDLLPRDEADVGLHFSQTVDSHPEKSRLHGCESRPYDSPDDDAYVRVLQLTSFVTHYLADFEYGLDLADLEEVKEVFFTSNLLESEGGAPLGYVRRYWTGRSDIVWVSTYSELLNTAKRAPGRMGGAVNDALGLGSVDGNPLVAVKYPLAYPVKCSKPNSFVANWIATEGYYLSSGQFDEWGLTESCTGDFAGQRERIHDGFHDLSDDFEGFLVGGVDQIVGDFSRVIDQGMIRLETCLRIP